MARMIMRVLLLGLLLVGPVAVHAQQVSVTPDVVYGHKYGMALTFDVFTPVNANGAAVLNVVSSGWRSAWRPHELSQRRYQPLLDEGFTVFAVRHGSSPKFLIPEIVPDLRRAVRYIRLNARQLGVYPSRLGVWGSSAGGHLSLILGTTSDGGDPSAEDPVLRVDDRVNAIVAYYPPVDLRAPARRDNPEITVERFPALGYDLSQAPLYSPILHVSVDDPPTLLIHGDADGLVVVANSHEMYAALQVSGVESKLLIIPGADHGFRGTDAVLAATAMVDWFVQHLVTRSAN